MNFLNHVFSKHSLSTHHVTGTALGNEDSPSALITQTELCPSAIPRMLLAASRPYSKPIAKDEQSSVI